MRSKIKFCTLSFLFIFVLSIVYININGYIKFNLKGKNHIKLYLNDNFEDDFVEAKICNLFACQDISKNVMIVGSVDTSKIGTYVIKYILTYNDTKRVIERKVLVIEKDTENPSIVLKGKKREYVLLNSTYKDLGATAFDNIDGDITKNIKVNGNVDTSLEGTYEITYTVSDKSMNNSTLKREVVVVKPIVDNLSDFDKYFSDYVKNKKYSVSVGYYNLDNDYSYVYNGNKVYYAASLIKTLVALYTYENMDLTDDIKEKVKQAISVSDNRSFVNLINKIGFDNLRKYGKNLGAKYVLNNGNTEYCGSTIVSDQFIFWKYLWYYINNNRLGDELKSYFINDYENNLIFNDHIEVMHKYGAWDFYFHDVGIVLDSTPYIIVILTKERNHNYSEIINDLSKEIYKFHQAVVLKI